jgi:chromosomal replication initiator protein
MESVWNDVKETIKKTIPTHSYSMWIKPIRFIRSEDSNIVLSCPNTFSKKRVLNLYADLIESEMHKISGENGRLQFEVAANGKSSVKNADEVLQMLLPNDSFRSHSGRFLRKDFTFDQFVVGNSNDFAYSASLSLASQKLVHQNSLFLLSKPGMGKSHLSQAIGNHILSQHISDKVYYITAEDFTNEMVEAFKCGCINNFKNKYRNGCDVLLFEDIHYLSGKERTQMELALTLDDLVESGKRIIFSSCYLPGDIPKISDKLRSRLSCSIISNIEAPDFRTRVRILQKKSKARGYFITDDVIHYLSCELTEDIRQLESGLVGVSAKSSLLGEPISLKLAESVVKNIVHQKATITIDKIKQLVCKEFNISPQEIASRSRKKEIIFPRQIAIYLSRRYTDAPLQTIGKNFNRYHATALHSIGTIERGIKESTTIKRQVELLCAKLDAGKI